MNRSDNWYDINNIDILDSPALVIYPQRAKENIRILVSMIDDVSRLRPHIKTHKSKEATRLCMEAGILKFKCATIAEAELLAMAAAPDILLAYQPTAPKLGRLIGLIRQYPDSRFSCLIDNLATANLISEKAIENNIVITAFLDLNIGMNRTGIKPGAIAVELYKTCRHLKGIELKGFHAYDGHIHVSDIVKRKEQCEAAFAPVAAMKALLEEAGIKVPVIVAGGSPGFPIYAKKGSVECSPGTFIYWDKNYLDAFPDQPFLPAALVISRVISLPGETTICLDLGHKSVAAENSLPHRVVFLNAPELVFIGQSEEHLVADAGIGHSWKVGDVLYGLPMHICPTCALYDTAAIVENGTLAGSWEVVARDRKINL